MSDNFSFYGTAVKKGFTLIELLVVMGLFITIMGLGIAIGFDSYRRDTLIAERNTLVSALQKARSKAVNNINKDEHGFYFDGTNYFVFEGASFGSRNIPQDLIIPRNPSITMSGSAEVVFEQLTGNASPTPYNIFLTDGISSSTISVNEQGRIDW